MHREPITCKYTWYHDSQLIIIYYEIIVVFRDDLYQRVHLFN